MSDVATVAPAWIRRHSVVFWDFDGVIKDSVDVKTRAFVGLFSPFGAEVSTRVRDHHERNGGMSRFEKLPLYLSWAGQPATSDNVDRYCDLFSSAVRQAVIDSAWVPGVREYLDAHHAQQAFVVITATPQGEIEDILRALDMTSWFREVHGAPTPKVEAIRSVLARWPCACEDALVVGDSESEHKAALANGVHFLLRRTPLNQMLQQRYTGPQCEDFEPFRT